MLKQKFAFAVSFVAMLIVGFESARADIASTVYVQQGVATANEAAGKAQDSADSANVAAGNAQDSADKAQAAAEAAQKSADEAADSAEAANAAVLLKQDKLTAGTNITISGSTISAKDTTYSTGTESTSGLTKLYTGTGTNTDGTMTQSALKTALDAKQGTLTAGTNITISGSTISAKDTTYSTGTASTSGLTKLYTSTGTSTDGTMTRSAITTELSGKQATLTTSNIKGAGSVSVGISDGVITVTGTDTNTTYSTGNATTSGLTKLYTGMGTNTDGTMTQSALKTALDAKQATLTAGDNVTISSNTISVPTANGSTLGVVKAGTNVSISSGSVSVATGSPSTLGVVKVGQIPSGSATSTTYATIWVE